MTKDGNTHARAKLSSCKSVSEYGGSNEFEVTESAKKGTPVKKPRKGSFARAATGQAGIFRDGALETLLEVWVDCGEPFTMLKDMRGFAERALKAYARVDLVTESHKIASWWFSNPRRRKTRAGVPRFLNGWFARAEPTLVPERNSQQVAPSLGDAVGLWGDE